MAEWTFFKLFGTLNCFAGLNETVQTALVCGGTVTVEDRAILARNENHKWQSTYRAGVNADVEVLPTHFSEVSSGIVQDLAHAVTKSRPNPDELLWPIPSGKRG